MHQYPPRDIIQTKDGNFIICGSIFRSATNSDIVVAKINGSEGKVSKSYSFGGENFDFGSSIMQTQDGGFIIAGLNSSSGGRIRATTDPLGGYDMYIIKLNADGVAEWDSKFGGAGYDSGATAIELPDKSYIVCGASSSIGSKGSNDVFIVRTNSIGQRIGNPIYYGDTEEDVAHAMKSTSDGGFIISGFTASTKEQTNGGKDFFLLKIRNDGSLGWKKPFGSTDDEISFDVIETTKKEFFAIGSTENGNNPNSPQVYYVKTNAKGDEIGKKVLNLQTFGRGASLIETPDCGLMIFGTSFNNNSKDFLLIKTDENGDF
ncbi:MAG: hypothetical protein HC815_41855 [Richelia sp. RM1_1_1]|nr:hypothetical protein [Richelia sp. RM1_1_1]